ncbi:hypothetical protein OROGR_022895 [Orobanche gracilis]
MENVSTIPLTDDQYFLLHLVTGAYFAPDLKNSTPRKSALQRRAEGLPRYDANDLAGSHIKMAIIVSVYYNILRKAERTLHVNQPHLLHYIHGSRPVPSDGSITYLSFDDLFPPELHKRFEDTIDNIVLVNDPNIDYIDPGDVERFKKLTGLDDFVFNRDNVMLDIFKDLYDVKVDEGSKLDDKVQETCNSTAPLSCSTCNVDLNRGMIFLPSCPSREESYNIIGAVKSGFGVTGSAARRHVGPILGLMDIGESEDSYLFRVSLPGVRRDERDFSCEVVSDGTVIIKGVTVTGERIVERFSHEFEMQSQNLCPPGPFSISFKLPGRVDPLRFHGTFATDGILEGVAFKAKTSTN